MSRAFEYQIVHRRFEGAIYPSLETKRTDTGVVFASSLDDAWTAVMAMCRARSTVDDKFQVLQVREVSR